MRMIVLGLQEYSLDLDATREAYRTDVRETELQKALVTDMARSCLFDKSLDDDCFDDRRVELEHHGLEKVPGFHPDLAAALIAQMDQPGTPLDIDDFLVGESSVVYEDCRVDDDTRLDFIPQAIRDSCEDEGSHEDEDGEDDESVTEG